jgi:hypothetical protein
MTRGRAVRQWDETAALMAVIANCHRNPKRRPSPYTADDFHPFAPRHTTRGLRLTPANIGILKVFLPRSQRAPAPPG